MINNMFRRILSLVCAFLVLVFLYLLPGAFSTDPHSLLGKKHIALAALNMFSLLVGWWIVNSSYLRVEGSFKNIIKVLLTSVLITQPFLFAILLLNVDISRPVIVATCAGLLFGLILVSGYLAASVRIFLALVAVGVTAMVAIYPAVNERSVSGGLIAEEQYITTSYHDLLVTSFSTGDESPTNGGAIVTLGGNRILVVTGSGGGRLMAVQGEKLIKVGDIQLNIPMNKASYQRAGGSNQAYFRITDAMIVPISGSDHLLVTHAYWDQASSCFTLRMSEAPWSSGDVWAPQSWTTRFESSPCVEIPGYTNEQGGRMALMRDGSLLFTVGSHMMEYYQPDIFDHSDYGKVLHMDLHSWAVEPYTTGHRNAQGLYVGDEQIYATEHGPFGGDELNALSPGMDYGWPHASYGTDYSGKTFKLGRLGDHSGYQRPVFAWTPSIGVSNLIVVNSGIFKYWRGDLLVGSLQGLGNGLSLYRVRIREGRVVSNERIFLNRPVRDLVELDDGRFLLWNGSATLSLVDSASEVISQCIGCHATRYGVNGIGPTLHKIVGARVARHKSFKYSNAMYNFGGRWTLERLDQFIQDPGATVPGTIMRHDGVKDPAARREIINYLQQATK